jgi:cytochrome bd-type quinol oxidase subunit 1
MAAESVLIRRKAALAAACLLLFGARAALAAPEGSPEYHTLFDPKGAMSWLNPRLIIWIFAELHLLFAAFVLAVPMFVVIIEVVGLLVKDKAQAQRYDGLAYSFCRLLTTAFSVTSILGAVFTFASLFLYPKMMSYLVDAFGPSMYLYALIFFGESFSLYLYYYGWGKLRGWGHAAVGLLLNAFGVVLMLIANAWTTFTMAPNGLNKAGVVVDRYAAFWNFLLTPINIHRLIANLCMGGSVAAAYAAYSFLTTEDEEKKAYYDWMGYIGNFVAVLALLPLPFAGYYLGFEIYKFNQQLGVYMMGGVLSWLFIMQAVLIGGLFFGANYYLWLGMDRIEGAERYRGWIKWMLGIVTVCMLIWATPHSLILKAEEVRELGGISHPILSIFGVMSAKNTAVNLVILTTFLSFILYRRGNKVPTVSWARTGKLLQALAFGAAAAAVVVIGIGGYIPSMWLESDKRIGMSPWQVLSVLACMVVVLAIDIPLFAKAKEVGKINWGRVSNRSQYCLIFLAVTFTWLMGLMGFVRSSLRQHWHIYEVVKDTSPWAFTPALGYATAVVTLIVMLFFLLVTLVVWITDLSGKKSHAPEPVVPPFPEPSGGE